MSRIARRIGDKRLVLIIRRFLQAGMMQDGVCVARDEGTPQGGPLSPLLANLLLDDLDQLLDSRGHRFCRYADDCNIYVRSLAAGQRVMESVTRFLEGKLKLRVNREKSAVAPVGERKFLGHRLLLNGKLGISPKSVQRAKEKIRQITRRNRGVSLAQVIVELNRFLVDGCSTTAWRHVGLNFNVWTIGFGGNCVAIASNSAKGARPSLASFRSSAPRPLPHSVWPHPERVGGVCHELVSSSRPCPTVGSQPRASSHWSSNMTRYAIRRNRRIHPSMYGGVGGRGREAPPTRFVVGQALAKAGWSTGSKSSRSCRGARWKRSTFYAIAERFEFLDHAGRASALGLGTHLWTPLLVADALMQNLP